MAPKNRLFLNCAKTEVIVLETAQRLRQFTNPGVIDVAGDSEQFIVAVKQLAVTPDATLSIDRHVTHVVRICNFLIRAMQYIRPRLTFDVARSVVCSFVGSTFGLQQQSPVQHHGEQHHSTSESPEWTCTLDLQ